MIIGDSYVFIGEEVKDDHFKKFTYGNCYRISSTSNLPDADVYGNSIAILFDNSPYGCLNCYFDKYFITLEDFRNKKIKKIIND